MAGEVVHVEFPSDDVERAQTFWNGLFGWNFADSAMPGMDYRMAQIAEGTGVAVFASDPRPEHPRLYLGTDDIVASIAKVRALGGHAESRGPVPGHGWFSACVDTEGNAFSLWQDDTTAGLTT